MTLKDIAQYRLHLQQIAKAELEKPEDVVRWMGVMQAQDYLASLWAIGVRSKNITEAAVEKSIAEKKIVRTWPLRGTLHFVAAEDVRWMLDNFAPRITAQHKARLKKDYNIDDKSVTRAKNVLVKALRDGKQFTRDEVHSTLEEARISTKDQRGLHLIWRMAHDGLICFGTRQGKQHTFTLLDEWVPTSKKISKDEALAKLASRYFGSHAPATVQDFAWWSGLPGGEAKSAIEMVKSELTAEKINGLEYFIGNSVSPIKKTSSVKLLPGFDEFVISYTDRTASLDAPNKNKINTVNGIFFPLIVVNGKVEGTWKREFKKDVASITTKGFSKFTDAQKRAIIKEAKRYGKFLEKKIEVTIQ